MINVIITKGKITNNLLKFFGFTIRKVLPSYDSNTRIMVEFVFYSWIIGFTIIIPIKLNKEK